jgi:malonyl-CoA/methylmalonyl-CoA synthetase
MTDQSLYSALRGAFPADLDRVAIETADGPAGRPFEPLLYTWRDLERGTAMMANLLRGLGLPEGSRVAVQTDKSVEALMLYLAVLREGLVYLPLNTAYQAAEMAYFIGNAEPAVVVCTPRNFPWLSRVAFQAGTRAVYTLGDDRTGSLLERAAQCSDRHQPVVRRADDLAAILYTSGTTGRSKGAMLSHGNLLSNAQVLRSYWGWRSAAEGGDVLIHALPIFHVHGLFVASHGALLNGSRMIWFSRFDPAALIARLGEATVFMGVPTLYVRCWPSPHFDRRPARTCGCSSADRRRCCPKPSTPGPNAPAHHPRALRHERDGMLTSNPARRTVAPAPSAPAAGRWRARRRRMASRALPTGEIGGIEIRGPNVFKGYWRMPEKTREEFTADGWFRTGDVGCFDADGYLAIVGRSKDLIISGGYNVYPKEIELAISTTLPGVSNRPWSACRIPTSARPWSRWSCRRRARARRGRVIALLKAPRELQGAQAGVARDRRPAAQRDGQGPEAKPVARGRPGIAARADALARTYSLS